MLSTKWLLSQPGTGTVGRMALAMNVVGIECRSQARDGESSEPETGTNSP